MISETAKSRKRQAPRVAENEKKRLVQEFRLSGMKTKEWCSTKGICFSTFKRWLSDQRKSNVSSFQQEDMNHGTNAESWTRVELGMCHDNARRTEMTCSVRIDVGCAVIHIPREMPVEVIKAIVREAVGR